MNFENLMFSKLCAIFIMLIAEEFIVLICITEEVERAHWSRHRSREFTNTFTAAHKFHRHTDSLHRSKTSFYWLSIDIRWMHVLKTTLYFDRHFYSLVSKARFLRRTRNIHIIIIIVGQIFAIISHNFYRIKRFDVWKYQNSNSYTTCKMGKKFKVNVWWCWWCSYDEIVHEIYCTTDNCQI